MKLQHLVKTTTLALALAVGLGAARARANEHGEGKDEDEQKVEMKDLTADVQKTLRPPAVIASRSPRAGRASKTVPTSASQTNTTV